MKKIILSLLLSVAPFSSVAHAQDYLTVSSLAANKDTRSSFQKMISNASIPSWVTRGGTDSKDRDVDINGEHYKVLVSCKPHDCDAQRIAVLYAPKTRKISGLFSIVDEKSGAEKLLWLNIPDQLSIDGKTVLYAALSGSLENHPDSFNLK